MKRASEDHIVAVRSWPVNSPEELPPFERRDGSIGMAEAWRRYRAGLVEIATGRETVRNGEADYIVEALYAIPRKTIRRGAVPANGSAGRVVA